MPSRPVAVLIVAFWLASTGWLLHREWWPWLRADSPPPFTIELADEAAPSVATWSIWRGEQNIGDATTRLIVQKDDTVELHSTINNLTLSLSGLGEAKASRMTTLQRVTREGKLLTFASDMRIAIQVLNVKPEMRVKIEGSVRGGKLHAQTRLEIDGAEFIDQEIDPIPLESDSLLNPLQPLARMPALRPGKRWMITHVDPFAEAIKASLQQVIKKQFRGNSSGLFDKMSGPTAVLAQVQDDTKTMTYQDKSVECYVIEYKSKDFNGRTWVRISDSQVLLQEVSGNGETVMLKREN